MAAVDSAVEYEGRRWPGVRAPRRGSDLFTAGGKGQRWRADRTTGIWRSFSELDVDDEKEVLRFLARHGDPMGEFDRCAAAGQPLVSSPRTWGPLIEMLGQVAKVWSAPGALGISIATTDAVWAPSAAPTASPADKALRKLLPTDPDGDREICREVEIVYAKWGLTWRPLTLRAFMVISAAAARERCVSMRQCAYCNDWFELRRSDAIYCTPSCQAADHRLHNPTIPASKTRKAK